MERQCEECGTIFSGDCCPTCGRPWAGQDTVRELVNKQHSLGHIVVSIGKEPAADAFSLEEGDQDDRNRDAAMAEDAVGGAAEQKKEEHSEQMPAEENISAQTGAEETQRSAEKKEGTARKAGGKKRLIGCMVAGFLVAGAILGWCGLNHSKGVKAFEAGAYETASAILHRDFLFSRELALKADFSAGMEHFQRGDYSAASEYFEKCGASHELHLVRWQEMYEAGEFQQALEEALQLEEGNDRTDRLNWSYLRLGESAIRDKNLAEALEYFDACQNTRDGAAYAAVIRDLQAGNYYQAAKGAVNAYQNYETVFISPTYEWLPIFEREVGAVSRQDIKTYLDKTAALKLLELQEISTDTVIEKIQEEVAKNGIALIDKQKEGGKTIQILAGYERSVVEEIDGKYFIPFKSLTELYETAGENKDGKVLIIQRNHHIMKNKEYSYGIAVDMMDHLPAEYYPASLEEVEYVVEIKYDFVAGSTYYGFGGTTRSGQITGMITVYKMPEKKEVYQSKTINGEKLPDTVYFYKGSEPSYFAGSAPSLKNEVAAALKAVLK